MQSITSKFKSVLASRQGVAAVLLGVFLVVFSGLLLHEYKHSGYDPAGHEHVAGSDDCAESDTHCVVCHLIFLHYLSPATFYWSALIALGCAVLYRAGQADLAILIPIPYFSRRGPPSVSSFA